MKKKIVFLLTSALCSLSSAICFSQSTAIIGTGTSINAQWQYPAPYGNNFDGAKHQILIRASEMTAAGMAAGNITAMAFNVDVPTGVSLTDFTIRMKTTSATTVSATFDNTGMVTVFGPQNYTDAAGWNTHSFSTPFAWNGTSNILIETCFNNNSAYTNAQMYYTATNFNSVSSFRQNFNPNICTAPSGQTSMNRPNIKFSYTPNGPPTVQFTANPTASCSGTVNFTDQSFYNVTSRLWNFGDGVTSTLQNPVHTYTASGAYSVSLTATNAFGNNTLVKPNYITISLNPNLPIAASCTPATTAYCCGFGITNFIFNTINNTSPDGSEGYADYTCLLDTITAGQSYNISVSTLAPAQHNVRAWIDFNNDGTFHPTGELIFSADNSFTANGTVFIPGTATLNTSLRLRVSADHSLEPVPAPCSNLKFGQAEDYTVYVKPNTNPPAANFSADDTITCSGSVQFTDQSQNVPTSWLWNFGDATTSNLQHPIHTYSANGIYSVSLTASNGNGNNTLVKTNYLTVTLGNIPTSASCQPSTFSYCCGYGIYKVQMGAINKSSADAGEGYQDFSCTDQANLTEGQSYSIAIQTSPSLTQDTKVWIDFNNDGTFTQGNELVFTSLTSINPTGNISIPLGAATVNKILRMRVSSENSGANQGSCTALIKGQAEDYGVTIQKFVSTEDLPVSGFRFQVEPNPFAETALLRITNNGELRITELKLFDVVGKEMKVEFIRNADGFVIRRGNLVAGIYIYKMVNEDGMVATGKLIAE